MDVQRQRDFKCQGKFHHYTAKREIHGAMHISSIVVEINHTYSVKTVPTIDPGWIYRVFCINYVIDISSPFYLVGWSIVIKPKTIGQCHVYRISCMVISWFVPITNFRFTVL